MRRLICLLLCILCLAGCAAQTPGESAGTTTVPTDNSVPQPTAGLDGAEPTTPGGPTESAALAIPDGGVIETAYYTITLPGSWGEHVGYTLRQDMLMLFEKESKEAGLGGRLFSLQTIPVGVDYSYYPSYKLLGTLTADGTEYNLVATFPTDVQFTQERAEIYNTMYDQCSQVLETLQAKDGCTFTPAQ